MSSITYIVHTAATNELVNVINGGTAGEVGLQNDDVGVNVVQHIRNNEQVADSPSMNLLQAALAEHRPQVLTNLEFFLQHPENYP